MISQQELKVEGGDTQIRASQLGLVDAQLIT